MKYLFFVLTVLVSVVSIKVFYYSFSISFANASTGESTRVNASTSASNTPNQNLKIHTYENLKEVSNKANGEDSTSSIRRSVSSVSENLNPNRFPQSLTMGIFGLKPISSEQILCISFFGKRSEEELTDLDMRAIRAVLKVEDEIKVAPLTRAEAKDSSILLQVEVKALYESKLRELLLKGISKELFERVRRKILDESKDSTQSEQSGVSARDQVLEENQKQYKEKLEWAQRIVRDYIAVYPDKLSNLKKLYNLSESEKYELLIFTLDINQDSEKKTNLLEALLILDFDPNLIIQAANSVLNVAIKSKHLEAVKTLLDYNANINLRSGVSNYAPIHIAVEIYNSEIFDLLLSHYPDLEIKDREGRTPFLLAASFGNTEVLKKLKDLNVNIFEENKHKHNSLILSSRNGHINSTEYLIGLGFEINKLDIYNMNSLMAAVYSGNLGIIEMLIVLGANVHQVDIFGETAMHFVNHVIDSKRLEYNHQNKKYIKSIVDHLSNSNLSPFIKNNANKTARQLVILSGYHFKNIFLEAELSYIQRHGLENIQELNDVEKEHYRDIIQKLQLAKTDSEKSKIFKRAARQDPRMGVQK